jgi:hypothetical protein
MTSTPRVESTTGPPSAAKPKKSRTGCVIAIIALAVIVVCCGLLSLLGWYILDDATFELSSSGMDLPVLDQVLDENSNIPPLDWFLGDMVSIEFINISGTDVCMIGITPSYALDLSEDVLRDIGILNAGAKFTTYVNTWVSVNILVLDCYGDPIYETYDFNITNEDISITLSPP